jgi:hypothetical protein
MLVIRQAFDGWQGKMSQRDIMASDGWAYGVKGIMVNSPHASCGLFATEKGIITLPFLPSPPLHLLSLFACLKMSAFLSYPVLSSPLISSPLLSSPLLSSPLSSSSPPAGGWNNISGQRH